MSETNNYAGFWKRATAISLDSMIIMCINAALLLLVTKPSELDPLMVFLELNTSIWTYVPQAIYYGFFLSSSAQSTPGKRMFSIYVVNQDGSRLSFLRGAARSTIGYFISTVLTMSMGFLFAAFRPDKAALHDMIFKTYVLEGEPQDKFSNALKSNSKYKEIYEKPITKVKTTTDKINLEMLIAEEETKLKAAQTKEKLTVNESTPPSEAPASEQKPAAKPKAKPDASW
jgi:uncharacterized RDD family membrane protein YckC